jgi:hypothetical protein
MQKLRAIIEEARMSSLSQQPPLKCQPQSRCVALWADELSSAVRTLPWYKRPLVKIILALGRR